MTFGSLFAGIGGLDLGLERAGMECKWQVEIDPYCQKVLAKHWPNVERFRDVRDPREYPSIDGITAGVPCQPVSQAAARKSRGGGWLWPATAKILRQTRPKWFLLENPESIRFAGRGLDVVVGDLTAMGYVSEWQVYPASLFGAPHRRARLWLVAHSDNQGEPDSPLNAKTSILPKPDGAYRAWPDPPRDLGMGNGAANRMDRIRACGNAVVPQVAEYVGRRIMEAFNSPKTAT